MAMTVKELKEQLANLPDDMQVICQKDAEGNGYSPLYQIDPDSIYVPDSAYSGEVYSLGWTAEECCLSEAEWERLKQSPKALILCPVN